MKRLVLVLLMVAPSVWAEDVVFYSGTTYQDCRNLGDTTVFLTNPNDYATIKPGYLYLPTGCSSLTTIPERYRKVDGGQVVEMTQAEKDAIDASLIAEQARQTAFQTEIDTNNLCTAELADIISRIDAEQTTMQAQIDAATNVASAKTAMTMINQRVSTTLTKVAKCVRARAR